MKLKIFTTDYQGKPLTARVSLSVVDKALSDLYGRLSCENLILEKDGAQKTPIYDILQFLSVTSGAEYKKSGEQK